MRKYLSFVMMAVLMTAVVPLLTACGSDDEDDVQTELPDINVGTHRVDVSFSGDTFGWGVHVTFTGTPVNISSAHQGSALYENGIELLKEDDVTWSCEEIRDYSVSTDSKSQLLTCGVSISKPYDAATQPRGTLVVHFKGYINGKLTKEKTYSMSPNDGNIKHIYFLSDLNEDKELTF